MYVFKELKHLRIDFQEIQEATEKFTTLIGKGGYGPVYRGQLSLSGEPTAVAVKQLQNGYGQGVKEFLTEIQLLSRYKHPNLISLVGFCEEREDKFLIYEYAKNGSLDKYLDPKINCPLTWKQRVSICVDAARGLDHLHNHVAQNQRVIHRDIKSANILLDHNWKAMIGDFGLSKIGRANENDTYLITNACGTHGYCDPAYIHTGILTKESDIYSFGVVLFEVLCGRLCFKNVSNEERFLAPLAKRYYIEGKIYLIVDGHLKDYINSDSMKVFSEIAFLCLQDDRKQRPSMGLVLHKLEKALKLIDHNRADIPTGINMDTSFGMPSMIVAPLASNVRAVPPQHFQRTRTYTKVYKRGAVGRSIDISAYSGYEELKLDLAQRFDIEGQLEDKQRGWKLVYVDYENDVLLVGDDPWEEFVRCARYIKILSTLEVEQMLLYEDFGENNIDQNQILLSSVVKKQKL